MNLTSDQLTQFFEDGFVVMPHVFSSGDVARMRRAFDSLESQARCLGRSGVHRGSMFVLDQSAEADLAIQRIVWCGGAEPTLAEQGRDPRLLRMAAQILGADRMQQLINQAHFKLPGDGVAFPWHQDSRHRRYGRGEWKDSNGKGSYVQMVIAVDDMLPENGPLQFLPGSCRFGHLEIPVGELPPSGAAEPRTVTMKAGSVAMFGPYTFHRSLPNRSQSARRVFINGYAYPGANWRLYPGSEAGRLLKAC